MLILIGLFTVAGATWFFAFSLTPYTVTPEQLEVNYSYQSPRAIEVKQTHFNKDSIDFTYQSFDGATVNGRIVYPAPINELKQPVPVLIGIHALGRSQIRWFQDSFKGQPTIEQVDKISLKALESGYAVIAIDARNHGLRKDPDYTILDVMDDMHFWGEREPYEKVITDTVRDHRILLDWLTTQPQFDPSNISVAGYSMGAQISLLLAGVDERIAKVAAIVPPYLDDKTAMVAPKNLLAGLADKRVWLFTANDDEHASTTQNATFFAAIPSQDKKHVRFDSGHLLPSDYVTQLADWF
jgi:cephalosporin-C deacetylase-like acetyl esterase